MKRELKLCKHCNEKTLNKKGVCDHCKYTIGSEKNIIFSKVALILSGLTIILNILSRILER